jgi:cell wall assembly regulator SMI1
MAGSPTVRQSWKRIESWLAAHALTIKKSLRPAATTEALKKLEGKIGALLPAGARASYRIHDGQRSGAENGLFPSMGDDVLGPEPAFRLLSVAEIGREWARMKEVFDSGDFAGRKSKPQRGIRSDWWNPGWVPIADNGAGDFFCIDRAPAAAGQAGQIIVVYNDMPERLRIAASLEEWLAQLADGLLAGAFVWSEDDEDLIKVEK